MKKEPTIAEQTQARSAAQIVSQLTIPKAGDSRKRMCRECLNDFETEYIGSEFYCPACQIVREQRAKEQAERSEQAVVRRRHESWLKSCPAAFLETDPERLPNKTAYERAMKWKFGRMGLLLHGKTGSGKSRTAWQVVKVEHLGHGTEFEAMNSSSAIRYAAMFSTSCDRAEAWLSRMCSVKLLLMDDVFKVKLTEAFEAAVFAIIDRRSENMLPIIATMNDVGNSLSERISSDRGEPMIRRLRESCIAIPF